MKRLWIFIIFFVLPVCMMAQQQTEYNRKGDDAMKRRDYSDAKMWYEEGVAQCDNYSIGQLTTIWLNNENMRPSMRSLMNKCLNCLNVWGTENDTTAVSKLIVYYTEGIGTPKSEELAIYWTDRLKTLREPVAPAYTVQEIDVQPRERMKFFVGYSYSMEAPYGLTVGGVARYVGWYVRFKTNMSFADYTGECNNNAGGTVIDPPANESYSFTNKKKINNYAGTAGIVVKCTPWLYTAVGFGYGERALLNFYTTTSHDDINKHREVWSKNIDSSHKGVAADLDVMVKLGPIFLSAGCNTINFKYIDLNAGLGVFF